MKKFSFAKIASLVFVCAMLFCALAVTAFAADDTVEIVSNNVYFGEKYQLMYAVNAPEGATLTATDSKGNAIDVVPYLNDEGEQVIAKGYPAYILAEGVAAQAIDEVITFTVEYNGTTVTSKYSVLQYVYERLNVKNIAVDAERAMFETFLAFADAANVFIDKEEGSFNDYKYVSVVGGIFDDDNTSGMYLPGATPFADIVGNIEVGAGQSIGWTISVDGAEATEISLADLKALTITGNTIVTATAVDSVCEHVYDEATCTEDAVCTLCGATIEEATGHDWADATCTAPKTCNTCGETEGAALGHKWQDATCQIPKTCSVCEITEGTITGHADGNKDGKCDTCSKTLYEEYSYTFTSKVFSANGTQKLGGINWTAAGDGGYWGNDNAKGQQFGSSSKPYKTLTLTSGTVSNVKEIKINTSGASSISGNLTVTVGGKQIGSTIKLTSTATEYTFTSSELLSGEVVLTYTQTSSKAIYIRDIYIMHNVEQ